MSDIERNIQLLYALLLGDAPGVPRYNLNMNVTMDVFLLYTDYLGAAREQGLLCDPAAELIKMIVDDVKHMEQG